MENIMIVVITVVLLFFLGFSMWTPINKKEGFENYDEQTCLTLAHKNEKNIVDLNAKITQLLTLQDDITNAKAQIESNTKMITQIVNENASNI